MKSTLNLLLTLVTILLTQNLIAQEIIPVKWYFETKYVFESGYWVYQDSANLQTDSITLLNTTHGYISPNPGIPDYQEFYLMEFKSHSFGYTFNEFIMTHLWRRNGGGIYGELGQPVMDIGQFATWPEVGNGFNGYEILDIFTSYQVGEAVFDNVVWSRVYEAEQYQYEFEFDTDIYFAENVGIIRKEYTDNDGIHHIWNLINYETENITTGFDEKEKNQVSIYPNPVDDMLNFTNNPGFVEICDMGGKQLLTSSKDKINVSKLPSGLYFIKFKNLSGLVLDSQSFIKK